MAMVSCGEAWGGRDTQVSLAESMGTLPGSISCRTNGVLEAQKSHHEPAVLVGLSILQAKSEKSTNGGPLQRKGDPGPPAHILLSCLTQLLSTQPSVHPEGHPFFAHQAFAQPLDSWSLGLDLSCNISHMA